MNTPVAGRAGRALLLISFVVTACANAAALAAGPETYEMTAPAVSAQQVKVTLQVEGHLKLLDPENKERRIPLEVSGNFVYEEKVLDPATREVARYYHTAEAKIQLEKSSHQPRLTSEHSLIGMRLSEGKARFWSPGGPLSRDESELIDLQASSVLLADLLPRQPVQIGDTWKPEAGALAPFLTIDVVNASEVTCKLAEIKEGRAVVEITGKASGAAEGVPTEVEVSAKYAYHLAERRFTSLAMAVKEDRSIGQAEPGLEITGRLTMVLSPLATPQKLTASAVAAIQSASGDVPPLRYESTDQGFRVVLDPRWRTIIDRSEVAVLRLVDQGDVIAQCNVSSLPPLEAGRRLQLEEFQKDIQKALGENFGSFLEASQSESPSGLRVLRVSAAGEASELAIHWIYYHVSNDDNLRLSYVFTMEADKAERFAGADTQFTANLELFKPTPSATPQQARATGAAAK